MERFAETIREIAIVGFEGVGKRIAFGFKDKSHAVVAVQDLINGSGTAGCLFNFFCEVLI